ncbi:hypothetical protein BGY98DRAFT_47441 [Russula aff. rugulosa BPL654]|nr:hypothetical protein BGY98DRAFT_47441 [Russula aff. rugulosa BPL654]
MPRPSRAPTRSGCTRPLGRHGGLGWDRLSALRPSSSDVLPACVDMRASSSTSSLTSIDRLALVLHLHHRGRTLLTPAVCPLSPSSSSATLPHPHRNVAIRRPACVRPPRPLTSIDRFALVLHLHHRGVTSGLGLERNGLLHRSARHHMLLLIFCFSLAFVVILIASRSLPFDHSLWLTFYIS